MSIEYVDYGGTQMLQPPYNAENVGLYAFLIEADPVALQKLLDARLNRPSGGAVQFEPAGPFVVLAFNKLEKMSSRNPPDNEKGWFSEQECAVWVRVIDRKTNSSRWFHPYIFVDNCYALVLGRELYGFPKATGWFDIPEDPTTASEMSVDTLTLRMFSPDTQGERTRLISARRITALEHPVSVVENAAVFGAELLGLLSRENDVLGSIDLVRNSLKDLVLRREPMVFLKQFPAPDVAGTACYQAIVEMTAEATRFRGAAVLHGEWQIDIAEAASHPVARELGLAGNSVKSVVQFWVGFDMIVGLGQNVWSVSTGTENAAKPRKVAILGGGVGAMTAALELTSAPDWKSNYDVTVYQMGWRLGGKGASGRGESNRIEEHGLHVWLGFYENAFRIIQQVYRENEANRPPGSPLRNWDEAFKPHDLIALTDRVHDAGGDRWDVWPVRFPKAAGTPGDGTPLSLWDAFLHMLGWVHEVIRSTPIDLSAPGPVTSPGFPGRVKGLFNRVVRFFRRAEKEAEELALIAEFELAIEFAGKLNPDPGKHSRDHHDDLMSRFNKFLERMRDRLRADLERGHLESRRLLEIVEFGMAIGIGLLRDGYFLNPGVLNTVSGDLQAWLKKHGASPLGCDVKESTLLRAFYDLVFAFEDGDVNRPSLETGPALRSILLIIGGSKGSIFWKMQAGMGDVVFAPIYEVLRKRGVKFEFFHCVERLDLNADGTAVQAIQIGVQATPADPEKGYDPLIVCEGLPAWPAKPRYELLKEGKELEASEANLESFWTPWQNPTARTLTAGKDFDEIVLGISIASLPFLFEDVTRLPERFQLMLQKVKTVSTQSLQLWVNKSLDQLGWNQGDVVLDAFANPMNTWAVMDQVISRESWPKDNDKKMVKGIHYFCGPLPGDIQPRHLAHAPRDAFNAVAENGKAFMATQLPQLWPLVGDSESHVVSKFFKANIDPSDRYVLSLAGSTKYRLRADESGLSNVVFAGDWTDNGFNAGCVEAATMSGIQAANAIQRKPLNHGIDGPLVEQLHVGMAAAQAG